MNLVFLLKNELGLLNQRQKGTSFVSYHLLWANGGVLGSRESRREPSSREPLMSRAAFEIRVPGTFLCGSSH